MTDNRFAVYCDGKLSGFIDMPAGASTADAARVARRTRLRGKILVSPHVPPGGWGGWPRLLPDSDATGRVASLEKSRRLGGRAAQDPEFWNWAIALPKRALVEMLLDAVSVTHAKAIHRKLQREGKI